MKKQCKFCKECYDDELEHLNNNPECDLKQTEEDVDSGLMDQPIPEIDMEKVDLAMGDHKFSFNKLFPNYVDTR